MLCSNIKPKYDYCSKIVSNYIYNLLKDYSTSSKKFYTHVYMSINRKRRHVPIDQMYIRKHFRTMLNKKEVDKLVKNNLLNKTSYNKNESKCIEYSIPDDVLHEIILLINNTIIKENISKIGAKLKKPNKTTDLHHYDEHKNLRSRKLCEQIKRIRHTMNLQDTLKHVGRKLKQYKKSKSDGLLDSCHHDLDVIVTAEIKRVNTQYGEDRSEVVYKPDYRISKTGRIFEVGSGVQGLSRETKRELYGNRENTYNYDITSCHLSILCMLAEDMGIAVDFLKDYIQNKDSKYIYAAKAGIDVKVFKTCLISLLYGSNLSEYATPFKILQDHYGTDAANKLLKFEEVISPLLIIQRKWMVKMKEYINQRKYKHKGKWYFKNAVDLKIDLSSKDAKNKKFMNAFIFQGMEASFISSIVILSDDYDYKVICNTHDGVITEGKIPDEAVEKAREESGFINANLCEVPF